MSRSDRPPCLSSPIFSPGSRRCSSRALRIARRLSRPTSVLAGVAGFLLAATAFAGLPRQFFPPDTPVPADDDAWALLAVRFPGRVRQMPAAGATTPARDVAPVPAALRLDVHEGLDFIRVHDVARDLPAMEEAIAAPALIIDLRAVRGELDESAALGALLTRREIRLETLPKLEPQPAAIAPRGIRRSGQVSLILVNRETSGPLEAVLDALQDAGEVLLVGPRTAGDVGIFQGTGWQALIGEYRRAGGPSLLDTGVRPVLSVETPLADDEAAWRALESGAPVASLLDPPVEKPRFDEARLLQQFDEIVGRSPRTPPAPAAGAGAPATPNAALPSAGSQTASENPAAAAVLDRTLQRAVNTVLALEALRRLPGNAR
jgi:hypothetical protein